MAVLFHELAADEGARAVRRAAGRLPMFPHDARPGGECFRFSMMHCRFGRAEKRDKESGGPGISRLPGGGPGERAGKGRDRGRPEL